MTPEKTDGSDRETAYVIALRLLNYRFRSEAELRRKLREKDVASEAIDETIERLRRQGWIDDARFAVQYARSLLRKKKGRRRIEAELRELGVDDAVTRAAIAEAGEEHSEEAAVDALLAKKATSLQRKLGPEGLDDETGRKKLAAYLFSQGYDAPAVFAAIDRRRKNKQ
ncbi:MAG: regulatory protein RecX [Acidobacteria bacterium]|nr:regulatory protein RecX [Acidobacteriota bacterium]